ncbi:hypothetical protein [Actinoplanes sp. GCM10030250]|uniref:hypothetical protein n=1 Tax=Actinoplanes sp. GCM10030250 TaxID=3273376 RepID=UPI00360B6D04
MPTTPPARDAALTSLSQRQEGVLAWSQARRHLSQSAIVHRIASQRWRRVHRGIYLTHTGPITRQQRLWIAALGVGNGRAALLGGPTALRVLGLRIPRSRDGDNEPIHVIRPARYTDRDPPHDVVVHRTRYLHRDEACLTASPPCTVAVRSMIDAAQWAMTDTTAIATIAASFQQRLVTPEQARLFLTTNRRLRRRPLIEAAVTDAGGGSESVYEIEFLRLCKQSGLPSPTRQAVRRDRSGRTRYRDVFFDQWRVQVEIDGSQHMEVTDWFADMRTGNEVAISGVRLLRFPGWVVRHRPHEVITDLKAALRAAGWEATHPSSHAA